MHRRQAAHHGVVLNDHVPRERGHVGHHDLVADGDIVRDVAVGQDNVVGANGGGIAVASGAVDGD